MIIRNKNLISHQALQQGQWSPLLEIDQSLQLYLKIVPPLLFIESKKIEFESTIDSELNHQELN